MLFPVHREHSFNDVLRSQHGHVRRLVAILIPIALAVCPGLARGQAAIEVLEAGWNGAAVPATWTPVRLRVTAGAQDMRALAEVIVDAEIQTGSSTPPLRFPVGSYGQELELRARETRDVTIWIPAEGPLRVRARLVERDETRAEANSLIKLSRPNWPVVAVLAEGPAIGRALRAIELPYQGVPIPIVVAELAPSDFPRSGALLEAVRGLVVEGAGAAELTDAQRDAVFFWVRNGGHLVVSGGPAAAYAARVLPDDAMPVNGIEFQGVANIGALGSWVEAPGLPEAAPVAVFRPTGGAVLAGPAERPLAWRTALGRGTITMLAIDGALEPISSWTGASRLWRTALAPALTTVAASDMQSNRGAAPLARRLWGVASMLPVDAHPSWRAAGGILILFALTVGPVLYLVLRRRDRHELRWIIVPVIALSVSAGAYVAGASSGRRHGITNVASYIEVDGDARHARQTVVAAFYGPMIRNLSWPLPDNVPVRAAGGGEASSLPMLPSPALSQQAGRRVRNTAPFQIIDGTDRRIRFNGGRFGLRRISLERELPEPPRVRTEVKLEGTLITGAIHNESDLPLDYALVIVGSAVSRLGRVAPGQSVPIRIDPDAATALVPYMPLSYALFGTPRPRRNTAQSGFVHYSTSYDMPNDPETRRQMRFVDLVIDRDNDHLSGLTMPMTVIAFTRAPTARDVLRPDAKNVHELTMLRLPVDLVLPPGKFSLPPALTRPERLEGSANPSRIGQTGNQRLIPLELRGDSVTYAFRPPLPPNARPEILTVKTEQFNRGAARSRTPNRTITPEPAIAGVFSIYDWQRAVWHPLPEGTEHRLDAGVYAGPRGEVRVRVAARDDRLVVFREPSLVIEGQVSAERRP